MAHDGIKRSRITCILGKGWLFLTPWTLPELMGHWLKALNTDANCCK